jgi:hypothetical protein
MYEKGLTNKAYMVLNSWIAHASHADTYGLKRKLFQENHFLFAIYDELKYMNNIY